MKTNIKATSIGLTPAISSYVDSKLAHLDKLTANFGDVMANVEVGKTTKHHKGGDFFFAEINLHMDGKTFREVVDDADLYSAIDLAKDKMEEVLVSYLKRKNTLIRRSGRAVKDFVKGLYNRKNKNRIDLFL